VIPELTTSHRVVVFYLPLAPGPFDGASTGGGVGEDYSFDLIVTSLQSVLTELNLPTVHLVGESFGGAVAQHFTLQHPDNVASLSIVSSLCHTEVTPIVQFKLNFLLPVVSAIGNAFPGLAQHLFATFHVDDVVEKFEPSWMRDFFVKEAGWAHHYSVLARIKIILRLDICEQVESIQQRTLVVYGEHDNFTKHGSLELLEHLPRAEPHALPGGHLPHLTSPKPFSEALLAFLASFAEVAP